MKEIILASSSPRRRQILEQTGLEFKVIPSNKDENIRADSPKELVEGLSRLKCLDVADKAGPGFLVVGADTVVVFEGEILGKPKDGPDAVRMLRRLCGNSHYVYTGVTIADTDTLRQRTFYEKTEVVMYDVPDRAIRAYVETGDPIDKAGSYGIQGRGAFLVEKINGDFYTVMGLPIARLLKILDEEFI